MMMPATAGWLLSSDLSVLFFQEPYRTPGLTPDSRPRLIIFLAKREEGSPISRSLLSIPN